MTNLKNGAPAQRDVAVYLDFENLYVSLKTTAKMDPNFDILMEKCREFGRVILARAYADWSEFSRMYTSQMFANGLEPVYVPTRKIYDSRSRSEARKNSVDIHITIDIIKSLFLHENVDVIILISGDRDYVPLINQIRQSGKAVYAIGVAGCTSSELSISVDEMFFYHQLLDSSEDVDKPQVDIYNQLLKALRIANRRGYPATLGIIKPIMKELVEGFHERNYKNARGNPFQKFKDLVQEAERRRLVRLVTSGATTEVYLWAEAPTGTTVPARREDVAAKLAGAAKKEEETAAIVATGREPREPRAAREPREPRERGERGERGGRRRRGRGGERSDALPIVAEGEGIEVSPADLSPDSMLPEGREDHLGPESGADDLGGGRFDEFESSRRELPLAAEPFVEMSPERSRQAEPVEASEAPSISDDDRLTGFALTDETWKVIREAVLGFSSKPPTPRKLMLELKKLRGTGAFGEAQPTDADLDVLIGQCLDTGRLKRERKGFSNVLRLTEPVAPTAEP